MNTQTTIGSVHKELARTGDWMTITDLVKRISAGSSTVGRALRTLRAKGHVKADRVPNDPNGRKQWAATGTGKIQHLAKLTGTVKKNRSKDNGKSKHITGKTASISFGTMTSRVSAKQAKSNYPKPSTPWDCPACKIKNPANHHTVCQACGVSSPTRGPSMSMNQAIETVVKDFVAAKKTFSAHDVTKELRERSNVGTVSVNDAKSNVRVGSDDVPRLVHNDVRDAVHEMFTQGNMDGYDRSNNGTYWEYGPAAAAPSTPSSVADDDDDDDAGDYDGSSSL